MGGRDDDWGEDCRGGLGGSAIKDDADSVGAGDGHESCRYRLVAAAEGEDGICHVAFIHHLDAVGNDLPRRQAGRAGSERAAGEGAAGGGGGESSSRWGRR